MRCVAPLVSASPRRAKRFLNTYLVVRARSFADPELRSALSDPAANLSLLVTVALLVGAPDAMSSDVESETTLASWIESRERAVELGGVPNIERLKGLREYLKENEVTFGNLAYWAKVAKRYTTHLSPLST